MTLTNILANYKLEGRTTFQGLSISIENDKGSTRQGVDKNGKPWKVTMTYPYGYIRMSKGVDGDHVDCFLGPNQSASMAYVIHALVPDTGKYDEDKCMLGFDSAQAAKKAFLDNYTSAKFFGSMDSIPMDKFKQKVLATKTTPKKIAAATMIRVGDPVTVDGMHGRGVVVKLEGNVATIKFRSGEYLSRDIRYVHSMNENTVNKMWNENQHQLTAGGQGSGCRGSNCGRHKSDALALLNALPKHKVTSASMQVDPVKNFVNTVLDMHSDVRAFRQNHSIDKAAMIDASPLRVLDPKDLKSSQPNVDRKTVRYFIENDSEIDKVQKNFQYGSRDNNRYQYVVVGKTKDGLFIIDGNHRAAAAALLDRPIKAKVVDLTKGIKAAKEWTELEEGKPIDRKPIEGGIIEQQGTLFCVKKGIENFGCYPTYEAAEERLHMRQSTVQAGRGIQHFGITKADKAILSQFDGTWKWGGKLSKRAHLLARAGYLQRDGFKFKMTPKGHDALTGKDESHIHAGGPGSGRHKLSDEKLNARVRSVKHINKVLEKLGYRERVGYKAGSGDVYWYNGKADGFHEQSVGIARPNQMSVKGFLDDLHYRLENDRNVGTKYQENLEKKYKLDGGGVGSGCHGENCGRKVAKTLEDHGWQKTKEWEDGAIYRHPDHPSAKIAVNHSEGNWRSHDSEGTVNDIGKHLASIHSGGPGSGRKPQGLNKWKSRDEELKDAADDPKQLKLPLKGAAPGTGWSYGQRHGVGFIPKRTLSGFPKSSGKGMGAPKFKTPAPNARMTLSRLKADYSGEPMAGNMSHSHIDPQVWFHPPSLKNADYVPTDDPGETDDRFGDVTKRNSKDTQEFRMKMLKKSSPGAMETVPVRTTLIAPNSGVYMPGQISGSGMLKQRPAKIIGAKRTHVSYNRRGCI